MDFKKRSDIGFAGKGKTLEQGQDDLEVLQEKFPSNQQRGRGWEWREAEISRNLVILNTPGIGESERRKAVITLGRFMSFEYHKVEQLQSDIRYLRAELERFKEMVSTHERDWPKEVTEFAKDYVSGKV